MWQDYVLASANVCFCLTLVPMLRKAGKPPLSSSVSTGVLLLIVSATLGTLHLWFASAAELVVGLQWLTLAVQKIRTPRAI